MSDIKEKLNLVFVVLFWSFVAWIAFHAVTDEEGGGVSADYEEIESTDFKTNDLSREEKRRIERENSYRNHPDSDYFYEY